MIGEKRLKIHITGVVQGVGFRPFIYNLAQKLDLKGWVLNSSDGVWIEVEGDKTSLNKFLKEIPLKAPPRAKIEKIETTGLSPKGYQDFVIKESKDEKGKFSLVSPDIATCQACIKELSDPADRRYRYPFINCTNCGPRFTIIKSLPYDRPKTTMKKFKMCPACQNEYDDPANRRFHAQPNACPECGPSLFLLIKKGKKFYLSKEKDPIKKTVSLLKEGKIVGVKSLGGFQLACDATKEKVVQKLRQLKRRPAKPFAIMVKDLKKLKQIAEVSPAEEKLISSPEAPIVLLLKKKPLEVAESVAPNNNYLGVMLPYTPLHHLLLKESDMILIMTSGNLSEEPICAENKEAEKRLGPLVDALLVHNRDIYSRYDDSVVRIFQKKPQIIRRARGYAPYPIFLPFKTRPILAVGPELKNTVCLTKENYAFLSQHIGDLENQETYEVFQKTIELYQKLFRIKPEVIAYDLHPDYLSTRYALEHPLKEKVEVQHHHAHIAGAMAENHYFKEVIGFSFDGSGYGLDGTIWGGEVLLATPADFQRLAHFSYIPLPGGELAIKKPYRIALSYLYRYFPDKFEKLSEKLFYFVSQSEAEIIKVQVSKKINSPLTSSCGRLFDAISSLLGVSQKATYEGQAAIELEMIANPQSSSSLPYLIEEKNGLYEVCFQPTFEKIIGKLEKKEPASEIAGEFHQTIVEIIVDLSQKIRRLTGVKTVVLAGGVFQNLILLEKSFERLEKEGFKVLTKREAPVNDGGVSLGQAVVAHFRGK